MKMINSNLIDLYKCMEDYNNVFRDDIKTKDLDMKLISLILLIKSCLLIFIRLQKSSVSKSGFIKASVNEIS